MPSEQKYPEQKRGRPPLPELALETYVVARLNAGETMKDIMKDGRFTIVAVTSNKPGHAGYEVASVMQPRSLSVRYSERKDALIAPWDRYGTAVPIFMGRPMKMPASVTENVQRKKGCPKRPKL